MSNESKIRAAVIGVGVGLNHIDGFQKHPQCDLAGICDVNPATLNERGDMFKVPASRRFANFDEMLKSTELDAISIALPNFLHEPVALKCLQHGKHLLCEKPLATDAASAQRIVDAAKSANKTLMVCYNHRYRPEIMWLKSMARNGEFGRIYAAKCGWLREGWIPTHGQWFTQKERAGGGALIDLGVHVLDLALWLMGYPQPVSVSGSMFAEFGLRGQKTKPRDVKPEKFDVEDSGMGFVRFADNSVLQFESQWASHREPNTDAYFVRLFGSEAGANFYTAAPNGETVALYKHVNDHPSAIIPKLQPTQSGHITAVAHFIECLLEGRETESPGEHGVTGLKIIDGIYESAKTGREVIL
jgi:predicted dehydrogenase